MQDFIKKRVYLFNISLPSFRLHASTPSFQIFVLVKASSFNSLVVCPKLELSVIEVKYYNISSMIELTVLPHPNTVFTGNFVTKKTFPCLGLVFIAHWTFN